MTVIDWTYLIVPAASLPAAVWLTRRRGAGSIAPESLASCAELLRLLNLLQQHRGLASGWLSGDASFESRMLTRRAEIDASLAALSPLLRHEEKQPRPCMTGNELVLFRHHWRTLTDSLASGGVEQSIAGHSRMIASVLDWLAAFGEARIDLVAAKALPPGIARNYTQRLPALAECLGQARALGSSVAVRKGCPPVTRVRLMFLVSRAETLLEQAGNGGEANARRAIETVRRLVQTIRSGMLAPSGVSLPADTYFAEATQAIDAVYAWAADCGEDIGRIAGGDVAANEPRMAW